MAATQKGGINTGHSADREADEQARHQYRQVLDPREGIHAGEDGTIEYGAE